MRRLRVLLAALACLLAVPVPGQEDEAASPVYFSLSSNRTFAPGEAPTVQLWSQNVDSLQFRVYRINDPVRFFQSLEDEHRFGGETLPPTPAGEPAPLERFSRWKRDWRRWARNMVRAQFSQDSRATIRASLAAREQTPANGAVKTQSYANVPVLNPEQVAAVWQQRVSRANYWDSQTVNVDVKHKGVYLVEATDGTLRAYTIVIVSELAVISKGAPGRLVAQVVDRRTGAPVPDCGVLVWAKRKELARLTSKPDGTVEADLRGQDPESILVMARNGNDFTVDSMYGYSLASNPERFWTGYIYTDRPVYRPGHTLHVRGILRTQAGGGYSIPDVRNVEAEIQDSDGKPVFRKRLPVSSVGTVHTEFSLPESAALGYYHVEMRSGAARVSGGFHVEEYRKPEYEVKVTPEVRRVVQGKPVRATIEARYYFGEPVAGANVTYAVHRSRYWHPLSYDDDPDFDDEDGGSYYGSEQIHQDSGTLDAQGRLVIEFPNELGPHDLRYRIEARVTDQANREISGSGYLAATFGSFLLRATPAQYVWQPGDRAVLNVQARDYDGNAIQTLFRFEMRLWQWNSGRGRVVHSGEGSTDAGGQARIEIPVKAAGSYQVELRAEAPEGREIESTTHLWVAGDSGAWGGERIQIVPDKRSYAPGETAHVLVVTGVPDAHLLVTTEGKDLFTRRVIRTSGASTTIDVPIRSDYAPNFFLNVVFLRDGQLYQGVKNIKVPPVERQLAVELTSSKPEYKPGERATFRISALDHQGRPAAAEFSLGVVDEAIYAIRRETAQEILNFFYGRGYNRVATNTSLSYYFQGQAGKRTMQLASLRRRNLAQLKPERLVDPAIRKAFPDTAFWIPNLRTDGSGHAQVQLKFPDALTTWRATARGVTEDTRVGSAVHRVVVRKNLILRLTTPRFFIEGDEVTVSALVHNYLAEEKTARVSLAVEGMEMLEGETRDVRVPSKGEARVDFRLRALPGNKAVLLGKALTNEESDALELTLPVQPYGVKLETAKAGSIGSGADEAEAEILFPANSPEHSRNLEITVAPSVAGAVLGALDYLTTFPYGCTEQTMSSFLPNVIVSRAVQELGLKMATDEAALQRKIRAGLDRLTDFQHEDGGWGWWKSDESHAFMTAYVVAGLAQARDAGVRINAWNLERAANWLRAEFDRHRSASPDLRAYMGYAMAQAGSPDRAVLDTLYNQRASMTSYGLALLGLALAEANDARASDIASELERTAKSDEREVHWPVDRDGLMDFYADTTPEATAYVMKLLARTRPKSPLLPKAASWLVNHRSGGYYWNTTKQTAMVIYGITDFLKLSGELKPDYTVSVEVNGRQVFSKRFNGAVALAPTPPVIRVPGAQLTGANRVRVVRNGEGRLYWSARGEYFSTEDRIARTGDLTLNIAREYYKLDPVRSGGRITYAMRPLEGQPARGDLVAVRLTVNAPGTRYLMIEDPIPAGTEFIQHAASYELEQRPDWWEHWYTRREFRDDRAALFQTYPREGPMQFNYLLKVVNPGRFRVNPARVQPMYQPQFLSTTESAVWEIR